MQQDSMQHEKGKVDSQDDLRVQDKTVTSTTTAHQDSLSSIQDKVTSHQEEVSPGVSPSSWRPVRTRDTPAAWAAIRRQQKVSEGRSLPPASSHQHLTAWLDQQEASVSLHPTVWPNQAASPHPAVWPDQQKAAAAPILWLDQQKNRIGLCQNRFHKAELADKTLSEKDRARVVLALAQATSSSQQEEEEEEKLNDIDIDCYHHKESQHSADLRSNITAVLTRARESGENIPGHQEPVLTRAWESEESISGHQGLNPTAVLTKARESEERHSTELTSSSSMAYLGEMTSSDAELASILQSEEYTKAAYQEKDGRGGMNTGVGAGNHGSRYSRRGRGVLHGAGSDAECDADLAKAMMIDNHTHSSQHNHRTSRVPHRGASVPPRGISEAHEGSTSMGAVHPSGGVDRFHSPARSSPSLGDRWPRRRYRSHHNGAGSAGSEDVSSDAVVAQLLQEQLDEQSAHQLQEQGQGNHHEQDPYGPGAGGSYGNHDWGAGGDHGSASKNNRGGFHQAGGAGGWVDAVAWQTTPPQQDGMPWQIAPPQQDEQDMSYEALVQLEDVPCGVDNNLLTRITSTHTYQHREGASQESKNCHVCMTSYRPGEELRCLPCLHSFHVACVDQWLHTNPRCPVCMKDIKELDQHIT